MSVRLILTFSPFQCNWFNLGPFICSHLISKISFFFFPIAFYLIISPFQSGCKVYFSVSKISPRINMASFSPYPWIAHAFWLFSFQQNFNFFFNKHANPLISSPRCSLFLLDFFPDFCSICEISFGMFWSFFLQLISSQTIFLKSLNCHKFFFSIAIHLLISPFQSVYKVSFLFSRFHFLFWNCNFSGDQFHIL